MHICILVVIFMVAGRFARASARAKVLHTKLKFSERASCSNEFLTCMYRSGKLTSEETSLGAAAIVSDHHVIRNHDCVGLAKASARKLVKGRHGKVRVDSRNTSRNLLRALAKQQRKGPRLMAPYMAMVPLWDNVEERSVSKQVACLPIHETLDCLVNDGEQDSWCALDASQHGLQNDLNEWASRVDMSDATSKPIAAIKIWGDSAPLNARNSLYLLTWSVLSGVCHTPFWFVAITKTMVCQCGCFGRCTFQKLFSILAWSFRALLAGEYPAFDDEGHPFPDGSIRANLAGKKLKLFGALLAKTGDWDWYKQALGLCGWKGEGPDKRICFKCKACKGGAFGAFDVSLGAPWRATIFSMSHYWTHACFTNTFVSALFDIPGFSLGFIRIDWMHVTCLGILQYLQGSVMWELFREMGGTLGGANRQSVCRMLEKMVRVCAKRLDVDMPFNTLTHGMIRPSMDKPPKLKLKAAEGRYFLPILRELLATCFGLSTPHERLRLNCVDKLCMCYEEMRNWEASTSPSKLKRLAREHVMLYGELSKESVDELVWRMFPKHHLFIHCSMDAEVNPRSLWNYDMESEIGEAVRVARQVNASHLHRSLLKRYRVTLTL
jgi:hypothetical protein